MGRTSTSSDKIPAAAVPATDCDHQAVIAAALERLRVQMRDALHMAGDTPWGVLVSVAARLRSESDDARYRCVVLEIERDRTHAWALAALERCRVLEAQLDSERRHADELVQRIGDVTAALGEHRTPGRPVAEDVRELAQRCAPTWGGS